MHSVYFDGACSGNPGPIGIGVSLVCPKGAEVDSYRAHMGRGTNNKSEYMALLAAIEMVKKHGLEHATIYGDSQLVIKQVKGEYKCNAEDLVSFRDKAQESLRHLPGVQLEWIRRAKNVRADELSKLALTQGVFSSRAPPNEKPMLTASQLFDDKLPATKINATYHPGVGFSVVADGVLYAVNLRPLTCSCGQEHCEHIQYVFNLAKRQRNQ